MRKLLPAAALLASGCAGDAAVSVVVANGRTVRFVATSGGGQSACVEALTVTLIDNGDRRDMWTVRRSDRLPCHDRLTYGVAPPGYDAIVTPQPLVAGRSYEVSVAGSGWSASHLFVK